MNQGIAELTLIYVLPLGISFVTLFATTTTFGRNTKVVGAILSTLTIVIDCLFYFVKNTIIVQNVEGGILLSFFLLFLFSILCMVQTEEWSTRAQFLFFSMCMLTGCIGTACFERPTLVLTSSYSPTELVTHNKKYEDYISSFDNAYNEHKNQRNDTAVTQKVNRHSDADDDDIEINPEVMDRLDTYADKAESIIDKMFDIIHSVNSFEPMEPNASEMEREKRSQQALAINNKATSLNRKAIGIFHPLEAREAHTELVQAAETIRSAAHAMYSYCLLEDPEEASKKYTQARDLTVIAKRHIDKFNKTIQILKTNNQPQQ
ncbi:MULTISPECIES: hypothetical protein [unclassified Fibrobacter]|uniref:hypothetical protein n=1 Tax=unclassified Fibrobacter TaxID=2634177 RepID=UPI00091A3DDC|nr:MULTISPECIES: hypothetical protein [unclassified Fibrobacter]SHK69407.1 hypothetical protein SAMN05720759_105169 [Fibrobacter sp. UWB12]SIO02892.1 hypothetical protein SAMN05720758_1083 [Fibrobacter sp. UWB11]